MKYIFIINPHAGNGGAVQQIRGQMKVLSEAERSMCSLYETKGEGDATLYVRKYLAENPGEEVRCIACGGDGTLNEVVAGAACEENAGVTCYPCGSGNDFVKIFGGVSNFTDIRRLLSAKNRKIDLLYDGSRYADNVINFGFDTTVAMTVANARARKGRAGVRYYTMGVIRALIHSMRNRFTITADGEVLNPGGEMLLCTIANGQYVGGSFRCAPRAVPDDGLIDVCVVLPISRLRAVSVLKVYQNGGHLDREDLKDVIIYRRAKKVEVTAAEGSAYSLDGEIIYSSHFTVTVKEKALNFAVPQEESTGAR